MKIEEDNYLAHYGILRRSGRYPWGSGGPKTNTGSGGFLAYVDELKKQGLSEVEIATGMGTTTTALRAAKTIAKNEQRASDIAQAQRLKEKGMSNTAIAQRMYGSASKESSVRALLAPGQQDKVDVLQTTAAMLRDQVAKKTYIDVGSGVEHHIPIPGLSSTKLNAAVALLQEQGYALHPVKIEQLGTGKFTNLKVLCPPGTTQKEAWMNRTKIAQVTDFTDDGGRSFLGITKPLSISQKRVGINYKEDGGDKADGVIYVRPGVPDVSLGGKRYAQVRIAVDETHFIKGMAMYKEDLPPGVDLVFNTNKSNTGNKLDALKPMKKTSDGKIDPDNPFGSSVRPSVYDPHTKTAKSVMNAVYEEGDWDRWTRSLSSQFLSKQSPKLAEGQLRMTYETRKNDLAEIRSLTNPAVRAHLLEKFADETDSAAVHLKAAAMYRQSSHVILPLNSLKENEIYAPAFRNGERVVLVRHPHGGPFEIPELTVNNRHPEGKKLLGDVQDAVAIHSKVAERLSGADFDGDTVLVIPNNSRRVIAKPALEGLKNFDPKTSYPAYDGMQTIDGGHYNEKTKSVDYGGRTPSGKLKQSEMGNVSNLITDMTIKGASPSELARAVRHSMVVIDAEKHHLNWRESARANGIAQLKEKYQSEPGKSGRGAATLISRAGSEKRVPERKMNYRIDPATGKKIYIETGATFVSRSGKVEPKMQRSTKLAETDDAFTLVSKPGTRMEAIYASHSNSLKAMANEARKDAVNTKAVERSPSAARAYADEVRSLQSKLNLAERNRPLERQAQVLANSVYRARVKANPGMDDAEKKKIRGQALQEARTRTGASKELIVIEPNEWKAIQAGAISHSKLRDILNNTDLEEVKKLATPKTNVLMTSTKVSTANSMIARGYTLSEIADQLGVSLSTLKRSIGGE